MMKEFFENPEKYKTVESWENSGLLERLSPYHQNLLSTYFYTFLKTDNILINDKLTPFYLPCLRRVFKVVIDSGELNYTLKLFNLNEVQLDIGDFVDYVNINLPKTLNGLKHLEGDLDHVAEACALVSMCYAGTIKTIYRDETKLKDYLTKIERYNKIDSIIN